MTMLALRDAIPTVVSHIDQRGAGRLSPDDFDVAVRPYLKSLHSRAQRITGDADTADDLVQDTLERGFRKRHLFQPGTDLRAWLLSIMRNVWISTYRRRSADPSLISLDALDELTEYRGIVVGIRDDAAVERVVVDGLVEADILSVIALLPPSFRDVVMLADVQGVPYKRVAELLRIPMGSVCSRLSRARQRLRCLLRERGHDVAHLDLAG
jgi:RNA polymerase sigma-70 factor (ECF subfamily)